MCEARINNAKSTNYKILSIAYVCTFSTRRSMKKKFWAINAMNKIIWTLAKIRKGIAFEITMIAW